MLKIEKKMTERGFCKWTSWLLSYKQCIHISTCWIYEFIGIIRGEYDAESKGADFYVRLFVKQMISICFGVHICINSGEMGKEVVGEVEGMVVLQIAFLGFSF